MSEFFIRRPIVAMVISIFMVILGMSDPERSANLSVSGYRASHD